MDVNTQYQHAGSLYLRLFYFIPLYSFFQISKNCTPRRYSRLMMSRFLINFVINGKRQECNEKVIATLWSYRAQLTFEMG